MPIGSKIVKGVLGRLTGDTPTKVVSDEEPKARMSRRGVLQGLAAAPVAGALGEIPVGKIIDDFAPVAKKVVKTIPKNAFDIPIFRQTLNTEIAKEILAGKHGSELKDMAEENLEDAIEMIDTDQDFQVMRDAYDWFRSGKKGDAPNDFAKMMDEEYSNTDPNEVANVIGDSNQAGLENWQETQKLKENLDND